ncbi:hypothetical protein Tco_1325378, partial [Tanacetum coccineum]
MGIEEFLKRMLDAESQITCDNTNGNTALSEAHGVSLRITYGVRRNRMEQGIAHKLVIVEVFHDLRGDFRVVYHDLCLGWLSLGREGECGFRLDQVLSIALVSSKTQREGCRASRSEFPY